MVFMVQGENMDITVYHNKSIQTTEASDSSGTFATGSGITVIGKLGPDQDQFYGSVIVDELAMWNYALSEAEVAQIYDWNHNWVHKFTYPESQSTKTFIGEQ